MRSDHSSATTVPGRLRPAGDARVPPAAVGASPGPPLPARRFDALAVAALDRLAAKLICMTCALVTVLCVRYCVATWTDEIWFEWRTWAVFFPFAIALFPTPQHSSFGDRRLNAVLQMIGQVLITTTSLVVLQLSLPLAGGDVVSMGIWTSLLVMHVAMCFAARYGLSRLSAHWRRPIQIVVVGADEQGVAMADHLKANGVQVRILGFVDDRISRVDPKALPAPFLGSTAVLTRDRRDVDGIVIALPNNATARIEALKAALRADLVNIYLAPEASVLRRPMLEHEHGGLETMMLLGVEKLPLHARLAKRVFDVVFSAVALIMFLPLGLVIALLIKLESPGPVIFTQGRFGRGNRLFKVYKFRSMRFDAADSGQIRLTERGDSRVTRVGDFLRRSSLDEFPQFFNVLLGQMSVVGPRPHPPGVKAGDRIYEEVEADFAERYKVRPGITGWAQVNGLRGNTFTEDHLTQRFVYDIQYIRNWSFELDLWIVLKTIWGGFGGSNAF